MDNGTLTQWNRLEPRPRKEDFSRALRAEIRDPLWMLTRQWQMGELTGEDTGTPVTAKIFYKNTPLQKVQLGDDHVLDFDESLPLEAVVERENISILTDITLSLALRRKWIDLLRDTFTNPLQNQLIKAFDEHADLGFDLPDPDGEPLDYSSAYAEANLEFYQMTAALHGRSFHGGKLYLGLKKNNKKAEEYVSTLSLSTSDKNTLNGLGDQLVAWFDHQFQQTDEDEPKAWNPGQLEYQFALSAVDESGGEKLLEAEEYYHGRLEWYNVDYPEKAGDLDASLSQGLDTGKLRSFNDEVFPSEAQFRGMPHNRWWEFEDGVLNFGAIQPNKSDTGKLLFAEFGLVFGNDWSIMPLTLPVGSLTTIDRIEIKDTFGQYTIADHYKEYDNNEHWAMFQLCDPSRSLTQQEDQVLFLPPVVHDYMESEPLEKVNFIRDEMANMVWGIEQVVPDGLGNGMDGYHLARQVREYYLNQGGVDLVPLDNDAKIKYTLATDVPENWIPFIPVRIGSGFLSRQIQLQRASMPRVINGLDPMRVEPQTVLLRSVPAPYHLHEEEVPRSGSIVTLSWQRTRMPDGRIVVWLGRKKRNGRGEGFSALKYDQISAKDL